jgi:hypothetical protein
MAAVIATIKQSQERIKNLQGKSFILSKPAKLGAFDR